MRPAALLAQAVSKSVILHTFSAENWRKHGCLNKQLGGTGKCELKYKKNIKILCRNIIIIARKDIMRTDLSRSTASIIVIKIKIICHG